MMATAPNAKTCTICEEQSLTEAADKWCPECDEYLCHNCSKHHGVAKATRKHKTVDIDSVHVLPEFILNIKTECEIHKEAMEYFCPSHDCSFCVKCTPKHRHCGEFTALRDMKAIKTSHSMVELEETIASLQSTLNKILESKSKNISDLTVQHHAILKQIKEIREKINNHLDQLEKKVLDDLETKYQQNKCKIEKLIKLVEFHTSQLDKIKDDLDQIKQHASDMQTYFGMRKLDEAVQVEENEVEYISNSKDIEEIKISFKPNPSCPNGNILDTLGTVEVTKKQVEITLPKPKQKAAQLFVPSVNVPSIDSIRVEKIGEVDLSVSIPNAKINDCCFTADDMILLTDYKNNQIIVLDQHGHYVRVFKLDARPNRIINFKNDIVVYSYSVNAIRKLNISNGEELNEVTFDTGCDALAVAGDRIIVHLRDKNYTICDQSLNIVGTIPVLTDYAPYLGFYDNKIFIPHWMEDTVYCYSMEGDLIGKWKDKNIEWPHGIAVSKHGYLFVAGYRSSNILAISQDGTNQKELLNLKNMMNYPKVISLNGNQNRLLITSDMSSKLLIYDLKNCENGSLWKCTVL